MRLPGPDAFRGRIRAGGGGEEHLKSPPRPRARWPGFPRLRELVARRSDPIVILPYLGYGTPEKLSLCGRVLEDEGFGPTADSQRRWRNLVDFLKRMESDEVPGVRLRATLGGSAVETLSDSQGYFHVELDVPSLQPGWHEIALDLPDLSVTGTGRVLVPATDAEFGVISDLDDTVVQSDVTRKVRMLLELALSNAHTRKPFEGVAAFYRALHRDRNPFFYVSKSPHNLYAPLLEFLQHQQLPPGPLLLRDFGLRMRKDHKTRAIDHILSTYPGLSFILVGDSGEMDPEIYTEILGRHPGRIRVIYIRSVDRSGDRLAAIEALVKQVAATKCQLVLAPDSEFAAAHAAAEGLIPAAGISEVHVDKGADLA
jgi:phosphatidate phosphatase APP1